METEFDVVSTLRAAGHDVRPLGVQEEIKPCATQSKSSSRMWCTHCWKNFTIRPGMTSTSRAFLELMRVAYTGCNPRGLILARGKDLVQDAGAPSPCRSAGLHGVSDAPQGQTTLTPRPAAHRQEPERRWILWNIASLHRRYGREAGRARRLRSRSARACGHRGAVH